MELIVPYVPFEKLRAALSGVATFDEARFALTVAVFAPEATKFGFVFKTTFAIGSIVSWLIDITSVLLSDAIVPSASNPLPPVSVITALAAYPEPPLIITNSIALLSLVAVTAPFAPLPLVAVKLTRSSARWKAPPFCTATACSGPVVLTMVANVDVSLLSWTSSPSWNVPTISRRYISDTL